MKEGEEQERRIQRALDRGEEPAVSPEGEERSLRELAADYAQIDTWLREWTPSAEVLDADHEAMASRIALHLAASLPSIQDPTLPPAFDDDDEGERYSERPGHQGEGVESGEFELEAPGVPARATQGASAETSQLGAPTPKASASRSAPLWWLAAAAVGLLAAVTMFSSDDESAQVVATATSESAERDPRAPAAEQDRRAPAPESAERGYARPSSEPSEAEEFADTPARRSESAPRDRESLAGPAMADLAPAPPEGAPRTMRAAPARRVRQQAPRVRSASTSELAVRGATGESQSPERRLVERTAPRVERCGEGPIEVDLQVTEAGISVDDVRPATARACVVRALRREGVSLPLGRKLRLHYSGGS